MKAAAMTVLCLSLYATDTLAHGPGGGECAASREVDKSRAELERTPDVLAKRFELADLLNAAGCSDAALHILEAVEAANPRNNELKTRLRMTRSLVNERQFFDGLDQAEIEARDARNGLRCTRFGDVVACDEALRTKPDDAALVAARADALLKANQLTEALVSYRRAAQLDSGNAGIAAKLAKAEAQQRESQQQCMSGEGASALGACQLVLVKDAPDEFEITRRIATLYQSGNQLAKALDFYIAANSLRRGDKSVALAIVALASSSDRSDAVALAARGSALVTLGKPRDAMTVLTQAQALSPNLPDVANQIAAAERLIRQEARLRESQKAPVLPPATVIVAAQPTYSNVEPLGQSH